MSTWQDRITGSCYFISHSGTQIGFEYESFQIDREHKSTAFTFSGGDGTYVQSNGVSGRSYPMRCFLYGHDYDQISALFAEALAESGPGVLHHPIDGDINVVVFGKFTRRDDLKTQANQAVFEVTFQETIIDVWPGVDEGEKESIAQKIIDANSEIQKAYRFKIDPDGLPDEVEQAGIVNSVKDKVSKAKAGFARINAQSAAVKARFDTIIRSVEENIIAIAGEPSMVAAQIQYGFQAPAASVALIKDRLKAFDDLARNIMSDVINKTNDDLGENAFYSNEMMVSAYLGGMVSASIEYAEFANRTEAIESALTIAGLFDSWILWRETAYEELEIVDQDIASQVIQDLAATAVGYLISSSFNLQQERSIVLGRNRTIIDLAAELYGDVDGSLDRLILDNDLALGDILELEKGREIVYYG